MTTSSNSPTPSRETSPATTATTRSSSAASASTPTSPATPGNDYIDASQNDYRVVIRGGEGDDTIYGSQYNDQIYGDGGSNYLYGLGGNDTFYCQNGSADTVDGGTGTNFMYADAVEGRITNVSYVFYG